MRLPTVKLEHRKTGLIKVVNREDYSLDLAAFCDWKIVGDTHAENDEIVVSGTESALIDDTLLGGSDDTGNDTNDDTLAGGSDDTGSEPVSLEDQLKDMTIPKLKKYALEQFGAELSKADFSRKEDVIAEILRLSVDEAAAV